MKNLRTVLEIIGEGIALGVLIIMVCQWSKMAEQNNLSRQAVVKMAEQDSLSAASIARIDSTIRLMHEANELTKESNDLTKQYVGEEIKKTSIEENRLQEELRPRLIINALTVNDIKKDTTNSQYTAWVTIFNDGISEANDIVISSTIASSVGIMDSSQNYLIKSFQPKSNPSQVVAIELPSKSGDIFLLTEISYNWVLPSSKKIPYEDRKGQILYRDTLTNNFIRCMKMQEGEIMHIFKK